MGYDGWVSAEYRPTRPTAETLSVPRGAMTPQEGERQRRILYAAAFLRALGVGLMAVLIGLYAARLGMSAAQIGVILSSRAVGRGARRIAHAVAGSAHVAARDAGRRSRHCRRSAAR